MAEKESVQRDESKLPPVNFTTLISEFALAASAHLGQLRTSDTDDVTVDLGMARRMIDTIELLKEKTQGNLTDSEGEFLEGTLYNLRMIYVRAAQNPQPVTQPSASETKSDDTTSDATAAENH
ncbi:MAG: DUF1844 domain-containing protein [Candidatus Poribacteria bacterium]|nr:DUF1844 domain-containing protein [Candidatus Poribacteria bacterium]